MKIELANKIIDVYIVRKNNKNIYFRFDKDLNLIVTANKYISLKEINKLIVKNEDALVKLLEKTQAKNIKEEEFWYLGKKYEIKYSHIDKVIFKDNIVFASSEAALNKYINNQIIVIFTKEVENLKNMINLPLFTLKFRKMKTRWGVCNYKSMTITLNTELIKYDIECLRYVIVHEMCHFYHHNHSKDFWSLVGKYYPNYKKIRKELRT